MRLEVLGLRGQGQWSRIHLVRKLHGAFLHVGSLELLTRTKSFLIGALDGGGYRVLDSGFKVQGLGVRVKVQD